MFYGKQVGVITYGGGINPQAFINRVREQGFVIVLHDGYAAYHLPRIRKSRKG